MNPREFLDQQKKSNHDLVQVKNSVVNSFIADNNAVALKTLFYIAKQRFTKNQMVNKYEIDLADFIDYTKLDLTTIRRNIKQMQKTVITFVDEDENGNKKLETNITLIPKSVYDYTERKLYVDMYQEIANLILEVENKFTTIDVKNLMEIKHEHAIRMLVMLEKFYGYEGVPPRGTFTLEDINGLFGTNYKTFDALTRKVLVPIKAELDEKSELSFNYKINKGYFSENDKKGRPKAISVSISMVVNKIRQRRLF